jgi:dTDP-4-dehydrorhamnose reductase
MGMKLLVTGGTGFLGQRIAAHFEKLDDLVLTPGHGALDITDEAGIFSWFRENRPDAVIHTAAVSDTGLCQREPQWSQRINVDGCAILAKACHEFGAKLVFCSSDQVYFRSPDMGPHRETDILTPGNVYGSQKLLAEQRCLEINPETVCLRLSWMYSRQDLPGQHGHFLATLKSAIKDENQTLSLPVYDRRGLTDVADVVKNLPKALDLPGGVWNFGSENDKNTYETVRSVLEELGLDAVKRLHPNTEAFADHPRDISMDLGKLAGAGITFPTSRDALLHALGSDFY